MNPSGLGTFAIGLDLGGTATKVGLFAPDGPLVERIDLATPLTCDNTAADAEASNRGKKPQTSGSSPLALLVANLSALLERHNVPARSVGLLGIAVASVVDGQGEAHFSTNISIDLDAYRRALAQLLPEAFIAVVNDADAAALGEAWYGIPPKTHCMLFVTLGTGVGGGIVWDGRLLTGAHGAAGEIGHVCVDTHETRRCNCGRFGCLEYYASASGLVRAAEKLLEENPQAASTLRNTELGAKEILDAARAGDSLAARSVESFSRVLGYGLAQISVVIDPDMILLGGGMSGSADVWLEQVRAHYRENAFFSCTETPIRVADLGNSAGIHGAVRFACQRREETRA